MIHNEQSTHLQRSWNQPYVSGFQPQTFRSRNTNELHHSPFQSLDEQNFILSHRQTYSINYSPIQTNVQQNNPQHYSYNIMPAKEYKQKPFAKISQFNPEQVEILTPRLTARFQPKYHQHLSDNYLIGEFQMEKSPRGGLKKKKITIVTKSLTPKSKQA